MQAIRIDEAGALERLFTSIHRGDRVFIHSGCAAPQYLIKAFDAYAREHPRQIYDSEIFNVWSLGIDPCSPIGHCPYYRHNSFFIGDGTRTLVNEALADYTPVLISQIPRLFRQRLIPLDVALIQTTEPNAAGYLSLGIGVDISRAALEAARIVIAQLNPHMPWVEGDAMIHRDSVDFALTCPEALLEFTPAVYDETASRIGHYVSHLVEDGSTIQVGYGSLPNAILSHLETKLHLGIHTELLTDGLVDLIMCGAVDNTRKTLDRGKTVASFCMGIRRTYEHLHHNPDILLRSIDYTNHPLVIARQDHMVAINSALAIDLTGQATAESIGRTFYSGIGGHSDFMRAVPLCQGGKTILTLPSTAEGGKASRIVPFLPQGAGVTLNRGDIHYVVTEYGIASLHGKNIRERAMELIAIAHPDFRPWLIEQARGHRLVYEDQTFFPGQRGEYPEDLETFRTTSKGFEVFLRPIRICDEGLLKDFVYSLSQTTLYRRFFAPAVDLPHRDLQRFVVIDYSREMAILAVRIHGTREEIVGAGRYRINDDAHTANLTLVVKDAYQNLGIGRELLNYLTNIARRNGLLGFTAEILTENKPMLHLLRDFRHSSRDNQVTRSAGIVYATFTFAQD